MLQARPQTDYHPRVSYSFIYTYFIYILGKDLNPTIAGSARINVKGKQGKRAKKNKKFVTQAKPPTPTQAIYALIGEEEENEN